LCIECNDGYYLTLTQDAQGGDSYLACVSCPDNCTKCGISTDSCSQCKPGFSLWYDKAASKYSCRLLTELEPSCFSKDCFEKCRDGYMRRIFLNEQCIPCFDVPLQSQSSECKDITIGHTCNISNCASCVFNETMDVEYCLECKAGFSNSEFTECIEQTTIEVSSLPYCDYALQ
jgi:hypothetical protein